jgi:hypothetical protein
MGQSIACQPHFGHQVGEKTAVCLLSDRLLEDVTPGQVIGWMLARPQTLTPQAEAQLDRTTQMDDQLSQARELTHSFLDRRLPPQR